MVTLSPEAGQGSKPGTILKRHAVGAPSARLAVPHTGEGWSCYLRGWGGL